MDNRTPEERSQDQAFMREVTAYFTRILGATKLQGETEAQTQTSASAPDTDDLAKNTSGLGSPHLGF